MSKDSRRKAVERLRAEQARRQRQRRWRVGLAAVVAAAGLAVGITFAVSSGGPDATASAPPLTLAPLITLGTLSPAPSAGALGSEGVPVPKAAPLASTATAVTGQPVDGIGCQTSEQTLFHIHAHLTVFVNGSPRRMGAAART
jgi:hypothetical protein